MVLWIGLVVVLVFPGYLIRLYSKDLKQEALDDIERRLADEQDASAKEGLEKQKDLVLCQTPWPAGNKLFAFLLVVNITLLVSIPLGLAGNETVRRVLQSAVEGIPTAFCQWNEGSRHVSFETLPRAHSHNDYFAGSDTPAGTKRFPGDPTIPRSKSRVHPSR